jgi:hypothetical protein
MQLDPLEFPEREIKAFGLGGSLELEFSLVNEGSALMSKARISSLDIVGAYLSKWQATVIGGAV